MLYIFFLEEIGFFYLIRSSIFGRSFMDRFSIYITIQTRVHSALIRLAVGFSTNFFRGFLASSSWSLMRYGNKFHRKIFTISVNKKII